MLTGSPWLNVWYVMTHRHHRDVEAFKNSASHAAPLPLIPLTLSYYLSSPN